MTVNELIEHLERLVINENIGDQEFIIWTPEGRKPLVSIVYSSGETGKQAYLSYNLVGS